MRQDGITARGTARVLPYADMVYVVARDGKRWPAKIGSTQNMKTRLAALQGGNHEHLVVVWQMRIPNAGELEREVLFDLRSRRIRGEWFDVTQDEAIEALVSAIRRRSGGLPSIVRSGVA